MFDHFRLRLMVGTHVVSVTDFVRIEILLELLKSYT